MCSSLTVLRPCDPIKVDAKIELSAWVSHIWHFGRQISAVGKNALTKTKPKIVFHFVLKKRRTCPASHEKRLPKR